MKQSCFIIFFIALFIMMPARTMAVKVVIDAGHGGANPGAVSSNGLEEKHVNLDIAYKLEQELRWRGYETVLLRQDDEDISLAQRVRLTNEHNPDMFISVHANYHSEAFYRGSMVLYYDSDYPQASYPPSNEMAQLSPQSRSLAQSVLDALVSHAGTENRGLLPSSAYVIRMGKVPSILVETAFLSNKEDVKLLADDSFRRKVAEGIAMGIETYMPVTILFPDAAHHWARESIVRLNSAGIVYGIGQRFEPDRAITRAEFLTILSRIFPLLSPDEDSAHELPPDLPENHWAYESFIRGMSAGIITGYPDRTVRPDDPISRGEAAVLFERMMERDSLQTQVGQSAGVFSDVPQNLWSAHSINYLSQLGILRGMAENAFMPERLMTRAESATIADRYLNLFVQTNNL